MHHIPLWCSCTCYHYLCTPYTCVHTRHNYDSYIYIYVYVGLSYATGGILLGGKDWAWSTASMVTAAIVCIGKRCICSSA